MAEGIVLQGIGGFYTVLDAESGESALCRPRGKLKRDGNLLPGDRVLWERAAAGETHGTIESVCARRTQLVRPPIANVDLAVVVDSVEKPKPNPLLIDRILVLALYAGLEVAVCLNKIDLPDDLGHVRACFSPYERSGIRAIGTSAKRGDGIEELRSLLANRVSTFAGPSGVGKSSLLNAVLPSPSLKTGTISRKAERGRHTTRHTELLPLPAGGLVADTPGFHQLSVRDVPKEQLGHLFPEIGRLAGECRFAGCLHFKEPNCAVRAAADTEEISSSRYENYVKLLQEIIQHEERRYK